MKRFLILFFLFLFSRVDAQRTVSGVLADSSNGKLLPFATVQSDEGSIAVITALNGSFSITLPDFIKGLRFSHIGYSRLLMPVDSIQNGDTIFLTPASGELDEVIIRNDDARIKRLINTAIRNRAINNPDKYDAFYCNVYYQMKADLMGLKMDAPDSTRPKKPKAKELAVITQQDSIMLEREKQFFNSNKHMFLSETFSVRQYKKPGQTHERIIAARFSGLQHSYFTNIVTDVLPFHLYADYLSMNGKDYINPIASGWLSRYRFKLDREILMGKDTLFQLSFTPRNEGFNSLQGSVYINSDGYAISHFSANSSDTARGRDIRIEHIYEKVDGHWFPKELNYAFSIKNIMQKGTELIWGGHSTITGVHFNDQFPYGFDKAHPVKMGDSVDLHTPEQWLRFRGDSLTAKEAFTYRFLDSFSRKHHLEDLVRVSSQISVGRLPYHGVDIDLARIYASNAFEGTRLGIGLYSNNHLSRYYSFGGWIGYGFKDKVWKGGTSFIYYPKGDKEHWIEGRYNNTYRIPGQINVHPEIDRRNLRNWVLGLVDQYKEYSVGATTRSGYWEWRAEGGRTVLKPLYAEAFLNNGKYVQEFTGYEASAGFRFAYAETRIPVFDYYVPSVTKYPVLYAKLSQGSLRATGYKASYTRLLTALTFKHHTVRWGSDIMKLEAGAIFSESALPRSFLMAGNGIRMQGINFYTFGGFITMQPFDYYSDRYGALIYRHDFDKYLWSIKWSKPSISIGHNMVFGHLADNSKAAGKLQTFDSDGYHESGLMLNQLLRKNFNIADLQLSGGAFFHWGQQNAWEHPVWVVGMSMAF